MTLIKTVVVISAGGTVSTVMQTRAAEYIAIALPTSWTTANVTFQVSDDALTWYDLFRDDANEVIAVGAGGQYLLLNIPTFPGAGYLRLRSGTAASPVAQAAERSVMVVTRVSPPDTPWRAS